MRALLVVIAAGVVPWVNHPLPLYSFPGAKLARYPTTAAPCHAAQLRVTAGRGGVGLGHQLERFVFTNAGRKTCLLRGYPSVTGDTAAGARVPVHAQHGGTYFGRLLPADVRPGRHVFLEYDTSHVCDGGRNPVTVYRDLAFTLPQRGTVRGTGLSLTVGCGLSMTTFGLSERVVDFFAAPGTPGTLHAEVEAPATVRAGTNLRYVLTLSNPTTRTVTLRQCPGYTQSLVAGSVSQRRSFELNCSSVHTLPAGGSVRYAMVLSVPRRAPQGAAKVGWSLNTPTGPFTAGVVRVTR